MLIFLSRRTFAVKETSVSSVNIIGIRVFRNAQIVLLC